MNIKKGDKVEIIKQFQDVGDCDFEWVAIEDEDGGRVLVKAIIPGMHFAKTEIFQNFMLKTK